MKRLVLTSILLLGRYAVLPLVGLAGGLLFIWLLALDHSTRFVLATAPIMFCVIAAAVALALGILFVPARRDRSNVLDEATAPALWRIWRELDPAFAKPRRSLRFDADFNASIGEARSYAGIFRQHVTMTVGLPLLMILDERAIRATIAHEVAHAELRHITGSGNLFDFLRACENVLHYANPDRTITGRIAAFLLRAVLEWVNREYRALSRQNELAADRRAAALMGPAEMARSLVLIAGGAARLRELVFAPLETDMLGAISVPATPLERISTQLAAIRDHDALAAAAAKTMDEEPMEDPDSTHPPLRASLANLGYATLPAVDPIEAPAIAQLLPPDAARDLAARLDAEWRKLAQTRVRLDG
ncbi:M48 family metalloprotease [Bradyrhizobium sp. 83012]|uniref:M48 family metalloprotease n=1 Tax=Bradyrhizobium aeschynomenes TaxID=2734909 RepID=A0ABX2CH16_9BRAD|nr:M48 family metalloprotease [Bradyrhizobium aeschynomenes]NPU13232.1 M48 family metalloprotease [Bradyrhizobium aeschynomenes]NPU66567.1 M48 family metalloprotease [Bradyrhizobium aeschynomenes]